MRLLSLPCSSWSNMAVIMYLPQPPEKRQPFKDTDQPVFCFDVPFDHFCVLHPTICQRSGHCLQGTEKQLFQCPTLSCSQCPPLVVFDLVLDRCLLFCSITSCWQLGAGCWWRLSTCTWLWSGSSRLTTHASCSSAAWLVGVRTPSLLLIEQICGKGVLRSLFLTRAVPNHLLMANNFPLCAANHYLWAHWWWETHFSRW